MRRFRFRVALLTLGVVFGYGSAMMRWTHGPDWRHHHHHCADYDDRDRQPAAPPARSGI